MAELELNKIVGMIMENPELVEKIKAILTTAATWRTLHKFSSTESGYMAKNGGACPRQVAVFAVYHLQPEDLPELSLFRIGRRET